MYIINALRTAFYRTHVSPITQQMCAGNSELSLHIDPNEYCTIQTSKCTLESSNCTSHNKHMFPFFLWYSVHAPTCIVYLDQTVPDDVYHLQKLSQIMFTCTKLCQIMFTCTKLYQIMFTSCKNCTRYCLPTPS